MYRTKIAKRWFPFHVTAWNQPIDELKDYFGEKTALYFEFLGHYTLWLVPLSMGGVVVIMSLAVQTALYGSLDEALLSGYAIPFYCIFVSFWAQFMIEFWKRKEATRSMEWGMTSFEEEEIQRPQYQGEMKASIIDGKMRKHFSSIRKFWRVVYSYFIISLMMLLVIVCVSLIFFAQYVVNNDVNDTDAQSAGNMAVSIMSAVQIQVLNMLYSGMAIDLTEKENHRYASLMAL